MFLMPGPCRAHVRPILGSPTILRAHQMPKFSWAQTSFVAPELIGDPNWTPFAAHSVAAAPNVSANAATGSALY
jgi:hypothetical protein